MNKERVASFLFFLIGTYGLILSLRLPLGDLREPGPGMLPLGLSILLLASGFLRFVSGRKREARTEKIGWHEFARKLGTPLRILGLTALFVLLLEKVGYLLVSLAYTFVLFFWISRFKWWIALGLAVAIGLGSWYFFVRILAVPLPQGFLYR